MMNLRRSLDRAALVSAGLLSLLGSACKAQAPPQAPFTPAPGSPIAVSGGPANLALGDVNRDGKQDLVVLCGKSRGVTVLLGQGEGRFRAAPGDPIRLADAPTELALADLDGDGKLDLAIGNHDSYGVTLLLGDGSGGFARAPNSPLVMKQGKDPHTHGLEAGDLNGDGKIDLVTFTSQPDDDASVMLGDGRGGFAPAPGSPFALGPGPYPGALADLDRDGHLDIVGTSTDRGRSELASTRALTILFADGKGGYRSSLAPLRTAYPWFVAVGDLNGDAKADLVATHAERRELSALVGDGKGGFAETTGSPFDLGAAAWHVAITELNGDGKADLVAAAGDGVRLLLGDGRGGFQPMRGSPVATGKGAWNLVVGDLDGNGRPDVATSDLESDSVTVLLSR